MTTINEQSDFHHASQRIGGALERLETVLRNLTPKTEAAPHVATDAPGAPDAPDAPDIQAWALVDQASDALGEAIVALRDALDEASEGG